MSHRTRIALVAAALMTPAGCAQKSPGSDPLWYRKPAKSNSKANTIDVGRINDRFSIELGASPQEATNSNDAGADIQKGSDRGLAVGNIPDRSLQADPAAANRVTGPNQGGGVDSGVGN